MSKVGTMSFGVVTPRIFEGDNLPEIVAKSSWDALAELGLKPSADDVIATTEAVVAIAQKNFITFDQLAADVRAKTSGNHVVLVNPIGSRNRMSHIVKGFAKGVSKLTIVLALPEDEQGNTMLDREIFENKKHQLKPTKLYTPTEVEAIFGKLEHAVTKQNYAKIYTEISPNIEVLFAYDPAVAAAGAKLGAIAVAADVHTRFKTQKTLERHGAEHVLRLDQFANQPIDGSGYNSKYGLLGANLHGDNKIKLFPDPALSMKYLHDLQNEFAKLSGGVRPEALVFGDGAYHDPETNINELCDPTTSPAYTSRLDGAFNEIKIKNELAKLLDKGYKREEAEEIIRAKIANKQANINQAGTTPRLFYNLLATAADLITGSGDKGTPVVYFKGYFNGRALENKFKTS